MCGHGPFSPPSPHTFYPQPPKKDLEIEGSNILQIKIRPSADKIHHNLLLADAAVVVADAAVVVAAAAGWFPIRSLCICYDARRAAAVVVPAAILNGRLLAASLVQLAEQFSMHADTTASSPFSSQGGGGRRELGFGGSLPVCLQL
jgi:hypothetical protein